LNHKNSEDTEKKFRKKSLRLCVFAPWRLIFLIFSTGILVACVPAETPKFLENTPGPPVAIVGEVYDAGAFTLQYPAEWVVVSGPANQAAAVTLVAPDESALIRVSVHPDLEATPDEDLPNGMRFHVVQITLKSNLIATISLGATVRDWEALMPVYEAVVESVRAE
jgi:hypothetical protein